MGMRHDTPDTKILGGGDLVVKCDECGVDLQTEFSVAHSKKKYKRIRHERYCSKYQKRHGVDPVE